MHRLIDKKLMNGSLIRVASPHLVARYNRGLKALTDRETSLSEFQIDATGYSPEIAAEFGDASYLDSHGINQKFILLSIDQRTRPVLKSEFTSTRAMFRQFVEDNMDELLVLTAKDVVVGEFENDTYRLGTLDDLLSIKSIRFVCDTANGLIAKSKDLQREISGFLSEGNAWADEDRIDRMTRLASQVGDIRRTPLTPRVSAYQKRSFYTSHFGGVYVLNDGHRVTVISRTPDFADRLRRCKTLVNHVHLDDRAALIEFLLATDAIETVGEALARQSIRDLIGRQLEAIVADTMARSDPDSDMSRIDPIRLKQFIYAHYDDLPREFHTLARVLKGLEQGEDLTLLEQATGDEGFFYLVRSREHSNSDLINHLLAHHRPFDVLGTFIANKGLFYERYEAWPDAKKSWAASYLDRTYTPDKETMRRLAYGTEPAPSYKDLAEAARQRSPWHTAERRIYATPAEGPVRAEPSVERIVETMGDRRGVRETS